MLSILLLWKGRPNSPKHILHGVRLRDVARGATKNDRKLGFIVRGIRPPLSYDYRVGVGPTKGCGWLQEEYRLGEEGVRGGNSARQVKIYSQPRGGHGRTQRRASCTIVRDSARAEPQSSRARLRLGRCIECCRPPFPPEGTRLLQRPRPLRWA